VLTSDTPHVRTLTLIVASVAKSALGR